MAHDPQVSPHRPMIVSSGHGRPPAPGTTRRRTSAPAPGTTRAPDGTSVHTQHLGLTTPNQAWTARTVDVSHRPELVSRVAGERRASGPVRYSTDFTRWGKPETVEQREARVAAARARMYDR